MMPLQNISLHDERHAKSAKLSCVIPSYNEGKSLALLLKQLSEVLQDQVQSWEAIIVNDGSKDDTDQIVNDLLSHYPIRYVNFSRNFGKEAALSAGFDLAEGDMVVSLDADLQHPPEFIPNMIERWENGADMVFAVRESRGDETFLKRLGTKLFYLLMKGAKKIKIEPDASDFRLMDRSVILALRSLPERTRFMKGLYAWVGFKAEAMPYQPALRQHGQSSFNYIKLASFGLDGITSFTNWPLRVAMISGVIFAAMAFTYACYLIIDYLCFGSTVAGWTTVVVVELFLAGMILIALGMIGEYIANIFDEVKHRPVYIIKQVKKGKGINE